MAKNAPVAPETAAAAAMTPVKNNSTQFVQFTVFRSFRSVYNLFAQSLILIRSTFRLCAVREAGGERSF